MRRRVWRIISEPVFEVDSDTLAGEKKLIYTITQTGTRIDRRFLEQKIVATRLTYEEAVALLKLLGE